MDEDNYEDTKDILGMLEGNLQKVGEHGVNTTRTLKAMEEMLKDRSGGIVVFLPFSSKTRRWSANIMLKK